MRILVWFALGFGAACAGCAYLLPAGVGWGMAIVFGALSGIIFLACRKMKDVASAAVVFLGCAVGLLWWQGFETVYLRPPALLDETVQNLEITVSDFPFETKYASGVDGQFVLNGKQYKVRVYLNDHADLSPGDVLKGRFWLNFSLKDEDGLYYSSAGRGRFLYAHEQGRTQITRPERIPIAHYPAYIRHSMLELMERIFPADTAGFAKALLLGDLSGIDYETDTAFKISGIRHIIAVSGLHVSILCGAIYFLTGRRRYLTSLLGVTVLLLFAAVAGFTPSVTRACVMTCLVMLSLLFNREYDSSTALAFAALVLLLWNPIVIISVSFQLSFGCMLGIFLFSEKVSAWLLSPGRLGQAKGKGISAKLKRWFSASVSVTLGAMVFTVPLSAYYFGVVSLVSVLTNLLVLWAVSAVFYGVVLACLAGAVFLPLGGLIAWSVSWLIRYILWIAKTLASAPFAAVYMNRLTMVAWVCLCYVLLGIFAVSRRKPMALLSAIAVISLCVTMGIEWIPSLRGDLRITVLDVGQGQCVLLQDNGKAFLVDCGGSSGERAADIAAAELLSQGISRLDGLILTHFDYDHSGGAEYLLGRVGTDMILIPGYEDDPLAHAEESVVVEQALSIEFGDAKITLFPAKSAQTANENSMCVLFQSPKCDILITGDRTVEGEAALLAEAVIPDLEILVAGHHGADTSTGTMLLEVCQPDIVVISVGEDNSYGHPSAEVLERLDMYQCQIHRTDLDGTFIYEG